MKLTKRVLYKKARICDFRYPFQNHRLVDEMLDFMRKQNGIGLAAPQIGISQRMFVMDINGRQWACFNPKIEESSEESSEFQEGCLSFPGEACIIKRPRIIKVTYQDADGSIIKETLDSLESRCFQHELDHLDGITMHERADESYATES